MYISKTTTDIIKHQFLKLALVDNVLFRLTKEWQ